MRPCRVLKRTQRRWASARGIQTCPRGYTARVEDNLLLPMSAATAADFAAGAGHEFRPVVVGGRPKLHALHSSAAMACNLFDHWRRHDPDAPRRALGLPVAATALRFEAPFATGLAGDPPTVDVAFTQSDGAVVAVECKFTEPFCRRRPKPPFRDKYFAAGCPVWEAHGMPRCARLADALQRGEAGHRHVDAAQLLKHALGLKVAFGDAFRLVYLYMPGRGRAGVLHEAEIAAFADAVDGEIAFTALDVPALLQRLQAVSGGRHDRYFGYLTGRYGAAR